MRGLFEPRFLTEILTTHDLCHCCKCLLQFTLVFHAEPHYFLVRAVLKHASECNHGKRFYYRFASPTMVVSCVYIFLAGKILQEDIGHVYTTVLCYGVFEAEVFRKRQTSMHLLLTIINAFGGL